MGANTHTPVPGSHKAYFEALWVTFDKWGMPLDDKPKNIASLRGYSYDMTAYFNHQAIQFDKMANFIPVPKVIPEAVKTAKSDREYSLIENWILKRISEAVEGERHAKRLEYSRLSGGLIAGGYLPPSMEESIINSYLSQYGGEDTKVELDKEIQAIRDGIEDGLKVPVEPPPIKCLFVPFTDINDYSDKAFRIWQRDRFYFIPKSTVYEILDFGFYISEYFLTNNSKPPQYQATAWKEFNHHAVSIYQILKKKTLITINDDYQSEFDSIQKEIAATKKRNRDLGNKIEWGKQECESMGNTFMRASKVVKWQCVEPGHTREPRDKIDYIS